LTERERQKGTKKGREKKPTHFEKKLAIYKFLRHRLLEMVSVGYISIRVQNKIIHDWKRSL
jgi:hypothetical protein